MRFFPLYLSFSRKPSIIVTSSLLFRIVHSTPQTSAFHLAKIDSLHRWLLGFWIALFRPATDGTSAFISSSQNANTIIMHFIDSFAQAENNIKRFNQHIRYLSALPLITFIYSPLFYAICFSVFACYRSNF